VAYKDTSQLRLRPSRDLQVDGVFGILRRSIRYVCALSEIWYLPPTGGSRRVPEDAGTTKRPKRPRFSMCNFVEFFFGRVAYIHDQPEGAKDAGITQSSSTYHNDASHQHPCVLAYRHDEEFTEGRQETRSTQVIRYSGKVA
jgi:hypothetical protein